MRLSSLSGDSLAAILPAGADYTSGTLSTTGTVINYTGKGLFSISTPSGGGGNTIRITCDGVQLADMTVSEFSTVTNKGGVTGISTESMRFNKSIKVEVITYTSDSVTVYIVGA